jgi:hypothetical protein
MVVFTLRQNQSFVVGYFKLFEGYVESPQMPTFVEEKETVSEVIDSLVPNNQAPSLGQPGMPLVTGGAQPPSIVPGQPLRQPPGSPSVQPMLTNPQNPAH